MHKVERDLFRSGKSGFSGESTSDSVCDMPRFVAEAGSQRGKESRRIEVEVRIPPAKFFIGVLARERRKKERSKVAKKWRGGGRFRFRAFAPFS